MNDINEFQTCFVQFLKNKFCSPYKLNGKEISRNIYSRVNGISGATLTRLNEGKGYDVPLSTIYKLCKSENITISDLFKEFEEY